VNVYFRVSAQELHTGGAQDLVNQSIACACASVNAVFLCFCEFGQYSLHFYHLPKHPFSCSVPRNLSPEELKIWSAFCAADTDGSGTVSKKELYAAFAQIGLKGSAKDRARLYGIAFISIRTLINIMRIAMFYDYDFILA